MHLFYMSECLVTDKKIKYFPLYVMYFDSNLCAFSLTKNSSQTNVLCNNGNDTALLSGNT